MTAKKTTTKRVASKKQPAAKSRKKTTKSKIGKASKPTVKKAVAKKKAGTRKASAKKTSLKKVSTKKAPARKAASKKKAVKKSAPKKAVAKKRLGKKTAAKKSVASKKTPQKSAPKKAAAKKAAAKKATVKKAVAKKNDKVTVVEKEPRKVTRKAKPKKKQTIVDPLTPRPKTPVAKLDVLRPGRKKAKNHAIKSHGYRPVTTKQREAYRQQLLELRERIYAQISSLKKDSLTRADEVNIEEDGTDAFDRQFALNLVSSENEALIAIDNALKRVEEGSYGKCQECGGGIEKARLKALPFVENCIACQSEMEKNRPGYRPPMRLD